MIHKQIQNKYSYVLPFIAVIGLLLFSSCSDNGSGPEEPEPEIETQTVEDLHASDDEGTYTFFDLETGTTISSADSASNDWDIAFSGTSVLVNSGTSGPGSAGAVVLDVAFDEVTIAPEDGYSSDTAEAKAIAGWYNYTGQTGNPQHAILALNKTIILKTANGDHYAKLEIMSYYQGNPDTSTEEFANLATRPLSQYFTFRYTIQLTEGIRDLQ